MIFCTQCGKQNDMDATFCNFCGAQLEKLSTNKKFKKKSSFILWLTLSILLVCAIATTFFHIKGSGIEFDWSYETSTDQK